MSTVSSPLKRKASSAFGSVVSPQENNRALFKTGKYSDLTIECGTYRFKAHKSVVCPQSSFFEAACENGFKGSCEGVIRFPEQKPYTVWRALQYLYTGEFSTEDKFDGGNDKDPAGGIMGMRPPHTFPEAKPFSELTNIIFVYNFAVMYDLQVLKEEARSLLSSKLRVVSEIDIIIAIGLMHAADYKDPKWFLSDIIKGLLTRITSASAQPTGKVPALLATPQYAPIVMPLMLQHLWRYGNTSKVMADFMFSAQVSDAVAGKGQGKAKRTQPKVKPAVFPKCSCGDFADEFDSRKVAFWCGNFECSSITGVAAKNSNPEPPAGSSTGV